jgi:limonene-1,2-epoxide hydrolase
MTAAESAAAGHVAVVRSLLDRLAGSVDEACRALADCCTDDLLWENSGRRPCHGLAEARELARRGAGELHFDEVRVDYRNIIGAGDVVMVERQDYLCRADGTVVVSMSVAGVFVFRGALICRWSDYFDYAPFRVPESRAAAG